MQKRQRILELLPAINQINDEKLRDNVVAVWVKAWEASEWDDPSDCVFTVGFKSSECNLIQHTNCVIAGCVAMASAARDIMKVPVDMDLMLAGAAMHDICKLLEFSPLKDKDAKYSETGQNLPHGTIGVHLALSAGLPMNVVHMIATHTRVVAMRPKNIEGIILTYVDYGFADVMHLLHNKPLLLDIYGK
ncbi:MAG: HDIG domain-containing protein [Dehalococcoidales bacterium]|nr:HDIG domain-containing protein [Dehalococcoidales bacterium]